MPFKREEFAFLTVSSLYTNYLADNVLSKY